MRTDGDGAERPPARPERGPSNLPAGARVAAVVGLLVVLALGERSATGLQLDSTPFVHTLPTAWVAVLLGLGTLFLALALLFGLRRRVEGPGSGGRRRSNPLVTLLVWAVALALATLVPRSTALNDLRLRLRAQPVQGGGGQAGAPRLPAAHSEHVLPLLLVAAVLALAALLLRRLCSRARPAPEPPAAPPPEEATPTLAEAGAAGLRRLAEVPDAGDHRAAVLAAYAAMEDVLARAGTRRDRAETPDELLDRVRRQALAGASAAERLVAVFGRSRWSSAPVGAQDRAEAAAALGELASLHDAPALGPTS